MEQATHGRARRLKQRREARPRHYIGVIRSGEQVTVCVMAVAAGRQAMCWCGSWLAVGVVTGSAPTPAKDGVCVAADCV